MKDFNPKFSKDSRHLILGQEKNNIGIENIENLILTLSSEDSVFYFVKLGV
ncbi:hypothetical protein IDG47_25645 [Staphylococcus sp. EG-SA-6]|uniref:hypothetical protein n=1 Tax=Staphylococcus TaxID=1279 RepID=UPI0004A9AA86|nr:MULTISPECIES: hypothetical protein [Staphylococcus]KDP53428.1 hypothetical protein CO98_2137 [Staphylococcus aureus subsp. aureus CO-98]MBN4936033.1 hypothetical protein [Staphylococcus sp. EG-SA-6]MBC3106369.1 hypothetical protein [Staphylococcus haemolyticus]MBK3925049.1 hypothetical protein [Staphylococcus haemolyticus]MBK3934526.1 hypothetical protein [Staphylococcus haemolyticus]